MALEELAGGVDVQCIELYRDRWRRAVATCEAAGVDLGAEMGRLGWALV